MLSSPGAVGGVPRLLCFTDARSADERPVSELTTAAINNAAPSMSFCSGQLNRFVSLREGRGRRSEGRPVRREILGRRWLEMREGVEKNVREGVRKIKIKCKIHACFFFFFFF